MNIIFHMEGGLGKHIMGTAIIKVIKKHHPNDNINEILLSLNKN